jgi:hypothetical protein
MMKILAAALVVTGAVWLTASTPANAAPRLDGIQTTTQTDLSAQRRHDRNYRNYRNYRNRGARVYSYPGRTPHGYYGPTYYQQPYARPAPFFFGLGGH